MNGGPASLTGADDPQKPLEQLRKAYGCVLFVCVPDALRDFGKTHRTWSAFCLQDGFSVLPPREFCKTQKALKRFATMHYLEFCRPGNWTRRKRRSNVLPRCLPTRVLRPGNWAKRQGHANVLLTSAVSTHAQHKAMNARFAPGFTQEF